MNNLKNFFKKPLQKEHIPKWIVIKLLVIALLGFADATYLVIEHYLNAIPPCAIGSCELVLTSAYSRVFGLPVSLPGALYYLALLVLFTMYLDTKREKVLRVALLLSPLGFLVSLYFFVIQAFVLHAFCQYCIGSAITSTLIFIISLYTLITYRKEAQKENMTCPIS